TPPQNPRRTSAAGPKPPHKPRSQLPEGYRKAQSPNETDEKKTSDCESTEQLQKQKIKLYQERRRMRWMFMMKGKKN
ncbi:hypothetical protein, partial [Eisenbergiella porci]|uniref:hypothetical protein n=1 Tax=Eisenbergiella porci TaxID=2652274 RepID=UPI002A832329